MGGTARSCGRLVAVWALSGYFIDTSWRVCNFSVLKSACKINPWSRAVAAICAQDAVWILDEAHVNLSVFAVAEQPCSYPFAPVAK